jgi:hypothetical protein
MPHAIIFSPPSTLNSVMKGSIPSSEDHPGSHHHLSLNDSKTPALVVSYNACSTTQFSKEVPHFSFFIYCPKFIICQGFLTYQFDEQTFLKQL